MVTFDDAYLSVLERAYPVLASLGLPGVVFVPTDWPDRAPPMSWPGISALGRARSTSRRCDA